MDKPQTRTNWWSSMGRGVKGAILLVTLIAGILGVVKLLIEVGWIEPGRTREAAAAAPVADKPAAASAPIGPAHRSDTSFDSASPDKQEYSLDGYGRKQGTYSVLEVKAEPHGAGAQKILVHWRLTANGTSAISVATTSFWLAADGETFRAQPLQGKYIQPGGVGEGYVAFVGVPPSKRLILTLHLFGSTTDIPLNLESAVVEKVPASGNR